MPLINFTRGRQRFIGSYYHITIVKLRFFQINVFAHPIEYREKIYLFKIEECILVRTCVILKTFFFNEYF